MSDSDHAKTAAAAPRGLPSGIRAIDTMSAVAGYGAAIALVLLAASVFVDVVGRTLFNTPLTGTLEMTTFWWMPALTVLAFAYTEQRQEHIKVTILLDTLPPRMRQIVEGSFGLLATALVLALAWYTLMEAIRSGRIQETTPGTPPVAIWPFRFVAAVGLAMLALQFAATTWRHFAGLPARADPDANAA